MDPRPTPSAPRAPGHLPPLVVRVAGLWILAGALFKLFLGTPADLPAPVRDFGADVGLGVGLTYRIAIGIELALAFLALLRPRLGWLPLVLLFAVFDAVLVALVANGAASCGCFGSKIPVPPAVMLAVDSAFLAALLLVRPWRSLADRRPGLAVVALALAAALVLPWLLDREAGGAPLLPVAGLRSYQALDIERWIGKDIWDTPLASPPLSEHIDVNALPPDGLWVLYRWTCDHCKEHLASLARSEQGERMVVLLRLVEPIDTPENRVVVEMPSGDFVVHAELPPTFDYMIQTPGELLLEGGRIVRAVENASAERNVLSPQ
jgi:hypothetical protein